MLSTADEGIQNLINTVSKFIGGERERKTTIRRSPFQKRDVHDGKTIGRACLKEALMCPSDTGKCTDCSILHRPHRISIGFEYAELAGRHAEFKGGHMLYLIPYYS